MTERPPDDPHAGAGDGSQGMNQAMQALSYLISGVVFYGGLGWLGDHYLGTGFLIPVGIVLGAGFGIYLVIKRFSAEAAGAPAAGTAPQAQHESTTKTQPTGRTGEGTT
jgi:ATP synthase protein I